MNTLPPIVVLDACVLYPAGLRSLLMWLAVHDLVRPKWSEQIHDEWMRNLLADRADLTRAKLERTRRLMDEHAGDCLVSGHARHIEGLTLPDEDDRHVLAAAIESQAEAIITWNLQDFPASLVTGRHGIAVQTPDQLLSGLLETDGDAVVAAMKEHRTSLKHPPKLPAEYLQTLAMQGLTLTVQRLKQRLADL